MFLQIANTLNSLLSRDNNSLGGGGLSRDTINTYQPNHMEIFLQPPSPTFAHFSQSLDGFLVVGIINLP